MRLLRGFRRTDSKPLDNPSNSGGVRTNYTDPLDDSWNSGGFRTTYSQPSDGSGNRGEFCIKHVKLPASSHDLYRPIRWPVALSMVSYQT